MIKESSPKKISIVINSLVQGGAQKSAILLANELVQSGQSVQILTFYPEETDFFSVPDGVKIVRLVNPFHERGRVRSRVKPIRVLERLWFRYVDFKQLRKMLIDFETDLLISFEAATSVITFMASLGKTPQIASERVHPGYHVIPKWAKLARPYIYRQKRVFVHCQGKVISDWISHYYQTPSFVIPNFLGKKINATWSFESNKVKIFSRYCEQKGIDLAIHAWSKLPEYIMKDFTLEIFGDGDRKEFENLVQELGLTQNIKLYGATKDMAIELSDCKLFLLPSRFEGFPNSLAEAIGAGIPSIATDCPSAIRDLTLNGDLAVLTKPTADSISESIVSLLADSQLQFKLNKDGGNLNQIFDEKIILDQWLELINYALNSKS